MKHSLSVMIVVTFFSRTVKILQFTHHSHKTSKMLFLLYQYYYCCTWYNCRFKVKLIMT